MNVPKRTIRYLRISVTNRCNLRCQYCMPKGYLEHASSDDILSVDDIARVIDATAHLGIDTVRITGGEPLLRDDLVCIIKKISSNPSIQQVAMTTNGSSLTTLASDLKKAGLTSVNISLDTLRRKRYHDISGEDLLPDVLEGIAAAKKYFDNVKLNVVVMRHINDDEIIEFCRFALDHDLVIRFIEFMPNFDCTTDFLFPKSEMLDVIEKEFGSARPILKTFGLGPAKYYKAASIDIPFGIISSVTSPSCDDCNRLRITADGRLLPCLYAVKHYDLKEALKKNEDVLPLFLAAVHEKAIHSQPLTCRLSRNMVELGG